MAQECIGLPSAGTAPQQLGDRLAFGDALDLHRFAGECR